MNIFILIAFILCSLFRLLFRKCFNLTNFINKPLNKTAFELA